MTNQTFPTNGVIYCATGKKKFLDEAIISVRSLRKYNKDIKVSIFVDQINNFKNSKNLFDSIQIIEKPEHNFADKIFAIRNSPYIKSIYIDCDTVITDDISELFDILADYDIAVTNTPFKNLNYNPKYYNAGFIVFNKNERTNQLFNFWNEQFHMKPFYSDQPTFREVVNKSSIPLLVLPSEYNFRLPFVSYAQNKVKILHGHEIMLMDANRRNKIIEMINETYEERIWFPRKGIIKIKNQQTLISKILLFAEGYFFSMLKKINPTYCSKLNMKKKKLIQYNLPLLINWAIPKEYRERQTLLNQRIKRYLRDHS